MRRSTYPQAGYRRSPRPLRCLPKASRTKSPSLILQNPVAPCSRAGRAWHDTSSWSSKRSRPLGKHFSNKNFSKKRRRNGRTFETAEIKEFQGSKFEAERVLPPIKALNPTQASYLDALRTSPQVIVLGPAGTGKTWIAATHAAGLFRNQLIDKIILTRPNVPCGRSLGYFPGTLEDKFAPWAAPVAEAIKERIGKAAYAIPLKNGGI